MKRQLRYCDVSRERPSSPRETQIHGPVLVYVSMVRIIRYTGTSPEKVLINHVIAANVALPLQRGRSLRCPLTWSKKLFFSMFVRSGEPYFVFGIPTICCEASEESRYLRTDDCVPSHGHQRVDSGERVVFGSISSRCVGYRSTLAGWKSVGIIRRRQMWILKLRWRSGCSKHLLLQSLWGFQHYKAHYL